METWLDQIMNKKHPLPHHFKPKSEQTKSKISSTLSGVPKSDDHCSNISQSMKGNNNPSKPLMFEGTFYPSIKQVMDDQNLSYRKLMEMVQSQNYPQTYRM